MKKNILGIQLNSEVGNVDANFDKVQKLIDNFYDKNTFTPDIIVLPEVWTAGWNCDYFTKCSDADYKTETFLSKIAKKYNVNLIGGSYIRNIDGILKNTCPIIDRAGKLISRYEKIHLYSPDKEALYVTSGKNPVMVDIEGLKIGLSICYDIRFPELFRSYINLKTPPELLINISAWPKTRRNQYTVMAQSRAIENQAYFFALSQTGEISNNVFNSGNSLVVEPMGGIIQKLDEKEGYISCQIDLDVVYNTREQYPNLKNKIVDDFGLYPKVFEGAINV